MRGLEPPLRKEHDPKSCASASSATSAVYFIIVSPFFNFHSNAYITNCITFVELQTLHTKNYTRFFFISKELDSE